jgi:hypothetical protein
MRPGALAAALCLVGATTHAQSLTVDGAQRANLTDASRELTRRRPAVTACLDRARANDPERLRGLRVLLVVLRLNRAGRATVVELHPPLLTPGLSECVADALLPWDQGGRPGMRAWVRLRWGDAPAR